MPYVICEKCGEYYKLGERESPEDFECNCGGKLKNASKNSIDLRPLRKSMKMKVNASAGAGIVLLAFFLWGIISHLSSHPTLPPQFPHG